MRFATLVTLLTVSLPGAALAGDGLYAGLSLGYGSFSGTRLIITDTGLNDQPVTDAGVCCPSGGLQLEVRTGYAIAGVVAPEFVFMGHGWDIGGDAGGAGFIGGGLRFFPLGALNLLDLDTKDFPIDISVGGSLGYNLVGKDFAYTGSFFGIDFTAEYKLSEVIYLGARVNVVLPSYSNFVFTDYGDNLGRCLDAAGSQDPMQAPFVKGTQACNGRGPTTTFFAPQLVATFYIPLFE